MSRRRSFIFFFTSAALGLIACEGNPPVRTGQTTLDFGINQPSQFGGEQLVWQITKYAGSPFFHWDFRDWELKGNPVGSLAGLSLPDYSLDDPRKLFMRYASTNAFWFSFGSSELWDQHEIDLFARDPKEHFRFLFDLATPADLNNDGTNWSNGANAIPGSIPFVPYMVYPNQANIPTPKPTGPIYATSQLSTGTFFDGATPTIPRTVKAAKIVKRGICSKFMDYNVLLPKIDDAVFNAMATQDIIRWSDFGKHGDCNNAVRRRFSNLGSFVNVTVEREDTQFGGFFLNTGLFIYKNESSAFFHDAYWFRLIDGRLGVEPQKILADGSEDDERLVHQDFMTRTMETPLGIRTLGNSVAEAVWTMSDDAQVLTTDKECTSLGSYISEVPCTSATATSCAESKTACGGFVQDILDGTVNAANQLTATAFGFTSFTAEDITHLKATVLEKQVSKTNGFAFKNFRCVERIVKKKLTPVCEYILRAKRINVFPNGVSLVYVDDHHDLSNPVYPIWLQFWAQHQAGQNQDPLNFLCDPPESQPAGQLFNRSYVNVRGDCTDFACRAKCKGQTCVCDCHGPPEIIKCK